LKKFPSKNSKNAVKDILQKQQMEGDPQWEYRSDILLVSERELNTT
jgi:hypothetical protein